MKKKLCCALLCSVICIASLTGCGKETQSSSILNEMPLVTSTNESAGVATPEPSTEAPAEETPEFAEDEVYAGISYVNALAAVRVEAGSGSIVNDVKKGALPDGTEAWEITISPITESESDINVVYYVHDDFCSPLQ